MALGSVVIEKYFLQSPATFAMSSLIHRQGQDLQKADSAFRDNSISSAEAQCQLHQESRDT